MELHFGPYSCAIGIHVLLEEIGAAFALRRVDVRGGETRREPFLALNPKGKVPVLVRDDGSTLTEFGAIATWLARTSPSAGLIPDDPEDEARSLEVMDYAVGTLHGQAFRRVFRPLSFLPRGFADERAEAAVRAEGMAMAAQGFALIDGRFAERPYAGGARFSIGDAALFYCERWAPRVGMDLPPNLAAHYARVRARPAVRRALEAEGLGTP